MKQYFTQIKDNKQKYTIFLLVAALFLVTRCAYLDRDLPPTGISAYVAIDEMEYTTAAFNLYHFGDLLHNPLPMIDLLSANDTQPQPTNILEIVLTYLTLSIFGNNYYGLRMASVLAAFVSFVLFYLVLQRLRPIDRQSNEINRTVNYDYMIYLIIFYLLFDFSFLMAGRVAEPTIFRLMALLIIIYIGSLPCFSSTLTKSWYSLLLGFVSMALVAFVYIYNVFILIAMAVTIVTWSKKGGWAMLLKQTGLFALGALICLGIYQVCIDAYYHTNIIIFFHNLATFRSRIGIEANTIQSIESLFINTFFIFMTNIFRFNIAFLFVFLVSLPVLFKKLRHEPSNFNLMIFNLLLFLLMQSVIINDWPLRKLVILLPLALLVIAISFNSLEKNNIYRGRYPRLYWFACILIPFAVWALYWFTHFNGEYFAEIKNGMYLNLAVFFIIAAAMTFTYIKGKNLSKPTIIICAILMLLPNIYLDNRYTYSNPTFYYRDAMIGMSEKINGEMIAGGYSQAFRLYNSSIPVLDSYIFSFSPEKRDSYNRSFDYLFDSGITKYSIAYIDDQTPESPFSSAYLQNHGLKLIERYELGNHVNAQVGLYEMEK